MPFNFYSILTVLNLFLGVCVDSGGVCVPSLRFASTFLGSATVCMWSGPGGVSVYLPHTDVLKRRCQASRETACLRFPPHTDLLGLLVVVVVSVNLPIWVVGVVWVLWCATATSPFYLFILYFLAVNVYTGSVAVYQNRI